MNTPAPGFDLYERVFSAFCLRQSSISGYCRLHAIDRDTARRALLGTWEDPRAAVLRQELIAAAGIEER